MKNAAAAATNNAVKLMKMTGKWKLRRLPKILRNKMLKYNTWKRELRIS